MANNCYNTFTFFGNAKVLKQVSLWRAKLKDLEISSKGTYSDEAIFEVFTSEELNPDAVIYLGVKWAYPDFGESIPLHEDELGFVSALSPMEDFQNFITLALHKLDKKVVVRLLYSSDPDIEGARYSTVGKKEKISSRSAQLKYKNDDLEDPDSALFYEHCLDSCEELIEEFPNLKSTLIEHMELLEKAMDEA